MAKLAGEVERGVHCDRCNKIVQWADKKRISVYTVEKSNIPINDREKVVNRTNLCNECYRRYTFVMEKFINNIITE